MANGLHSRGIIRVLLASILAENYIVPRPTLSGLVREKVESHFYARPMEQMQINVPKGIKVEFLVYCPEMPHEAPSVISLHRTILEGCHLQTAL
jgi:hypothetical protein